MIEYAPSVPIPILTYHHVSDRINYYTSVTQKTFNEHISTILQEFEIISLKEALRTNPAASKGKVVITIDDGYADARTACKILSQHNATATLFVITKMIGKDNKWNHKAPYITKHLTAEEIIHLSKTGFDIGSHGRTHQNLPKLDDKELEDEVIGSKQDLIGLLGESEYSFCYPFGAHDSRVRDLVNRHYSAGLATNKTCEDVADRAQLFRLSVNNDVTINQIMDYLYGKL